MPEGKTECRSCGAAILVATAERTGGFCMPCKRIIPTSLFDPASMRADVSKLIAEHPCLAPVADQMIEAAFAGLQLVGVWTDAPLSGGSRFGGVPDVPSDFVWPRFSDQPLGFFAQINCAEIARFDPDQTLPLTGLLSVFYPIDEAGRWRNRPVNQGGAAIVYTPSDQLAPANVPTELHSSYVSPTYRMVFLPMTCLPGPNSVTFERFALSNEQDQAFGKVYESLPRYWKSGEPAHVLLGYPTKPRRDMQVQCQLAAEGNHHDRRSWRHDPAVKERAADWRLLFQLDRVGELNGTWGATARLYFWIRKQDLQLRRFDLICAIVER